MFEDQFKRGDLPFDVDLQRPTVKVYIVLEPDIDAIRDAGERETNALAFGSICIGGAISGVLSLLLATPDSPAKCGIYAGMMGCLVVLFVFFARTWWFERGSRQRTITKIKSRPGVEKRAELAPIAEPMPPPRSA